MQALLNKSLEDQPCSGEVYRGCTSRMTGVHKMSDTTGHRLDLKALQCFCSMARHGSLVQAGLELGMSEMMAERYVQSLEHRLDTKLFEIRNGQIELTHAGQRTSQMTMELFDEARLAIAFYRHQHT